MEDGAGPEAHVEIQNEVLEVRDTAADSLATILRDVAPRIETLRAFHCDLHSSEAWYGLVPAGLTRLTLSNSGLHETPLLSALLQRTRLLRGLDLSDNFLTLTREFSTVLSGLPQLEELVLSGNWLGSEGLWRLSGVLGDMQALRKLGLAKTCAEGDGLAALARALAWSQIAEVDLSYNCLRKGGWGMLLCAMPLMQRLEVLDISGNCLEDEQLREFFRFSRVMPSLRSLKTADNFQSPEMELSQRSSAN